MQIKTMAEIPTFTPEEFQKYLYLFRNVDVLKARVFIVVSPEGSDDRINRMEFDSTTDYVICDWHAAISDEMRHFARQLMIHREMTKAIATEVVNPPQVFFEKLIAENEKAIVANPNWLFRSV
jgi:hypothetical protein